MLPQSVSRSWLALLALVLLPLPQAGAEPVLWSYSTTAVTTGSYGNGAGETFSNQANIAFALTGVSGDVTPSTNHWFSGTQMGYTLNSLVIQSVTAGAPLGGFGTFSPSKNTFDLTLRLTDGVSGASESLVFHGGVVGSISIDMDLVHSGQKYASVIVGTLYSNPSQSLQLGGHTYTIQMAGPQMLVQVSAPEPSTLALATAGLAGLCLRAWRRRRAPRPAKAS